MERGIWGWRQEDAIFPVTFSHVCDALETTSPGATHSEAWVKPLPFSVFAIKAETFHDGL